MLDLAYDFIREYFLYKVEPDTSHHVGQRFLEDFRWTFWLVKDRFIENPVLRIKLAGVKLSDPFILAAGWDKNGKITKSMVYCGFRNITIGSVRPNIYFGNKRPWFDRDPHATLPWYQNSMGLPSEGAETVARYLKSLGELRERIKLIIGYSGNSAEEILQVDKVLGAYTNIRELDVSCPNVPNGTRLERDLESLETLVNSLNVQYKTPISIKISQYQIWKDKIELKKLARKAQDLGLFITASNTLSRTNKKFEMKKGGLSGPILYKDTVKITKLIYQETENEVPIIATGGIETGRQAFEIIGYGASAVGFLTVLIRRGPFAPSRIRQEFLSELSLSPYSSVEDLRGKLLR